MLTRRQSWSATIGGLGFAVGIATVALAAAPAPHAGKYYDNSKRHSTSGVLLLISSTGHKIVAGADFFRTKPGSSVDPACPAGQADAGFNGTSLKLSHRHYGFSDTWIAHAKIIEARQGGGENFVPTALKITITGTVKNAKTIAGKLKWKGCDGSKTQHSNYTASYDPSFTQ